MGCYFCEQREGITGEKKGLISGTAKEITYEYKCPRCGEIYLHPDTQEFITDIHGFTKHNRRIISIYLRNEYEQRRRKPIDKKLNISDLKQMIELYREMDAIEKMDNTLLIFEKRTKHIGQDFTVNYPNDYPLYHCFEPGELVRIIEFLHDDDFIKGSGVKFDVNGGMYISAKGYEQLREIKKSGKDSRQCFVAMWFTDEMANVYDKAIKHGIEYVEAGENES